LLVRREAFGWHALRDAFDERDAGLVKPAQDLLERVLGLVRVLVLVPEPRPPPAGVERHPSQSRVEEHQAISGQTENEAASIGGEPSVTVIETNDNETAGPEAPQDRLEPAPRIAGVMKDTVGNHHVKRPGLERRTEEVHLQEGDAPDV